MSSMSGPYTVDAVLTYAGRAGRGTVAHLLPLSDQDAAPMSVFAFKGDAQGRLRSLAQNAGSEPGSFYTAVRVTYYESAKGHPTVARALDVELLAMAYNPRPVPTLRQHLGAYLQAWGKRLAA